jgi:2-amino-4-hydroxy-6-hydroxymethyldihydropteridine diphosphokinase
MILIAIGANLPSRFGSPQSACQEALRRLTEQGIAITRCSDWYESAPVPLADQPWYVNGVAQVETDLAPRALLERLHQIEAEMGRVRSVINAPRVIDLDLLAYDDFILAEHNGDGLNLPHPRMTERAFVVLPLRDVAANWIHPETRQTIPQMIGGLPQDQKIRPIRG